MELLGFKKGSSAQLSDHFSVSEFDCKCKYPECTMTRISPELIDMLEEIRMKLKEAIGRAFPIVIKSGYRCEAHNADTPGAVDGSQHPQGRAADIIIPNKYHNLIDIFVGDRGGVGFYDDRLHIDVRGSRARWNNKH